MEPKRTTAACQHTVAGVQPSLTDGRRAEEEDRTPQRLVQDLAGERQRAGGALDQTVEKVEMARHERSDNNGRVLGVIAPSDGREKRPNRRHRRG